MDKVAERDEIDKEKNMVAKIKESHRCEVQKMDAGKAVLKKVKFITWLIRTKYNILKLKINEGGIEPLEISFRILLFIFI